MGRRLGRAGAAAGLALWLAACASTPEGVVHVVRPGENVYRISRFYGVSPRRVIDANGIRDVSRVPVGARLVIPGSSRAQPERGLTPPQEVARATLDPRVQARRESDLHFGWPVSGRVSSRFGWRRGRRHEGIDIPADTGTPIRAAEAGRVIHSGGGLGDYGNVVIVKHSGRYSTVYAHNRKNLVRKGDFVEKGEVIGQVGRSGNARGAHVHFEIRRSRRAQDPIPYLP